MARPKKENGETTFEGAAPTDVVALEMTKEEAEEFAQFKLKKEQEALKAKEAEEAKQLYVINLAYSHNINGVKYGPGRTEVPEELVGLLQHNEQNTLRNEIRLNQSADNFFKVSMQGAGVKRVDSLPNV
jgi:hypothetical protein